MLRQYHYLLHLLFMVSAIIALVFVQMDGFHLGILIWVHLEITHYLNKIGFRFREFGVNTIIIDEIPPDINWGNESQIIREIIDQYISVKKVDPSFIDQIAAIYACKSAVKAGDQLKPEERIHLVDRLFSTDHPYYFPHGRPIIINLSINELDQRFERNA